MLNESAAPAPLIEFEAEDIEVMEDDEEAEIPPERIFAPRWFLNGFPKAGTHLLVSMMNAHANPMPSMQFQPKEWLGTFHFNSWSDKWADIRKVAYSFGHLRPGYFYKGHCGHRADLETFMWFLGVAHVMIYRDFRDVAVSQTHHILSERGEWKHQDKDAYRELGGFDEALAAVIAGLQTERCYYPGVMERWALYAPWLDVAWVLNISYEEGRTDPVAVAKRLIEYGLWRLCDIFEVEMIEPGEGFEEMAQAMAEASQDTEHSPTFRRGVVGGWREAFTDKHKRLFKESDKQNWLVRLGYESSADW